MPKTNRFDAPATVGYTSQFVPEKLPQELMAGMLSAKQRKADQGLVQATKLGEFEQRAIGDHDTNYVKGIKSEVQQFADDAMNMDRTSPEFQRKYIELTRKIKSDPNLSKVASAVANYDEHAANIKRLQAAGKDEYAAGLDYLYQQRLENYSKVGGEGFEGQGLADANIQKGQNEFETVMKYFDKVTADGYESLQQLDSGISYKTGFTAITDKKLQTQAANVFESFLESDMGNQMRLTFLMRDHGKTTDDLANMSKEERTKVDTDVMGSMRDRFMKIGLTKKFSKSTTNKDGSLNAQRTEDKENYEVIVPTSQTPYTVGKGQTQEMQLAALKSQENAIWKQLWLDGERIKQGFGSQLNTETKASMRKQANLLKGQQADLNAASADRYQSIAVVQQTPLHPTVVYLSDEQAKLSKQLTELVGEEKANSLLQGVSNPDTFWKSTDQQILRGNNALKSASQSQFDGTKFTLEQATAAQNVLKTIQGLEERKLKVHQQVTKKVQNIHFKEEKKRSIDQYVNGTTVQPSGVTVQTGQGSVMNAFNTQVVSNSEAYTLRDSKGKPIVLSMYGPDARITNFEGSAVTSTGLNQSKGQQVGVDGKATITVPDGTNRDGSAKTKQMVISVNAEPAGNNGQFYRNAWAKELRSTAVVRQRQGDTDQANLAYTTALQLGNSSVQNELDNFAQSPALRDYPISVPAYSADGQYLKNTNVLVEKIGDPNKNGGYKLQLGDRKFEYKTINEVNEAIQAATNSIEK